MRVESGELRVKIWCVRFADTVFYGESLPLWGKVARPARRMRGKYPGVAPSSVTCGDSFPRRGKPFVAFTRYIAISVRLQRAAYMPPLQTNP